MQKLQRPCAAPYLIPIAILLLSASCLCGGQTGGFCGGDDSAGPSDYPADGGQDAATDPTETEFGFEQPCPFGMSAAEVLQKLSEASRATLIWHPVGGQSGETGVTVEMVHTREAITYLDYIDPRCDLSYGTCDALRIPVRITIRTDDGLFDDQWEGEVLAYQDGTIVVQSTKPLDLRNLNGSYPAASFIEDDPVFSGTEVENMQSVEAQVAIHYGEEERYGAISGIACGVMDENDRNSICKSAGIATWSY